MSVERICRTLIVFLGLCSAAASALAATTETGPPLFRYAAFATSNTCGAITFSGNKTDSFDSSQGSYATTKQDSAGNIGTNGNINLSGGGIIYGTVSSPHNLTGTCSSQSVTGLSIGGGASVTGGLVVLSAPLTFANPPLPNPLPPTTKQNLGCLQWHCWLHRIERFKQSGACSWSVRKSGH